MFTKILKELIAIRRELQTIHAILQYMAPSEKSDLKMVDGKKFINRETLEDVLKSQSRDSHTH